jgi:DNA-binding response OmpR family regulator
MKNHYIEKHKNRKVDKEWKEENVLYPNNFFDIKRRNEDVGKKMIFGDLQFDTASHSIENLSNGKIALLKPSEYMILHILAHSAGQIVGVPTSKLSNWIEERSKEKTPDSDVKDPLASIPAIISTLKNKLVQINSRVSIPDRSGTRGQEHEGYTVEFNQK